MSRLDEGAAERAVAPEPAQTGPPLPRPGEPGPSATLPTPAARFGPRALVTDAGEKPAKNSESRDANPADRTSSPRLRCLEESV